VPIRPALDECGRRNAVQQDMGVLTGINRKADFPLKGWSSGVGQGTFVNAAVLMVISLPIIGTRTSFAHLSDWDNRGKVSIVDFDASGERPINPVATAPTTAKATSPTSFPKKFAPRFREETHMHAPFDRSGRGLPECKSTRPGIEAAPLP